jgi:hypothetical protein
VLLLRWRRLHPLLCAEITTPALLLDQVTTRERGGVKGCKHAEESTSQHTAEEAF